MMAMKQDDGDGDEAMTAAISAAGKFIIQLNDRYCPHTSPHLHPSQSNEKEKEEKEK